MKELIFDSYYTITIRIIFYAFAHVPINISVSWNQWKSLNWKEGQLHEKFARIGWTAKNAEEQVVCESTLAFNVIYLDLPKVPAFGALQYLRRLSACLIMKRLRSASHPIVTPSSWRLLRIPVEHHSRIESRIHSYMQPCYSPPLWIHGRLTACESDCY